MADRTIAELQRAKAEVATQILRLLHNFQEEYEVEITDINLMKTREMGAPRGDIVAVDLTVRV